MPRAKLLEIPEEFIQPPSGISARGRELWLEAVQSYPLDHFAAAHRPALYTRCEARAMAEKLRKRLIRMTDPQGIQAISAVIAREEATARSEERGLRMTNQSNRPPRLNPNGRAISDNPAAPTGADLGDQWQSLPFPASGRPN